MFERTAAKKRRLGQIFFSTRRLANNADTGKIMLGYAKALPQLKKDGYHGALDVPDIKLRYLANGSVL